MSRREERATSPARSICRPRMGLSTSMVDARLLEGTRVVDCRVDCRANRGNDGQLLPPWPYAALLLVSVTVSFAAVAEKAGEKSSVRSPSAAVLCRFFFRGVRGVRGAPAVCGIAQMHTACFALCARLRAFAPPGTVAGEVNEYTVLVFV